jgi:3-hydroxyisobutyrate dehydrogenase-like beta-hydroxyacid dehydrogenase
VAERSEQANRLAHPVGAHRWAHKGVRLALAAAGKERARLRILNQIDATGAEAEAGFGADDLSAIDLALRS